MLAGSHIALGAVAWVVAAPHFGQPALDPGAIALAVLGGLLPDIDHPKSWVGNAAAGLDRGGAGVRASRHHPFASRRHRLLVAAAAPGGAAAPRRAGGGRLFQPSVRRSADAGWPRLAWPFKGTWALPVCRTGSPFEPLVVALLISAAWASLPERPDPWRYLDRIGFCLTCEALPLPPSRPPRPPRRRLADQTPHDARG